MRCGLGDHTLLLLLEEPFTHLRVGRIRALGSIASHASRFTGKVGVDAAGYLCQSCSRVKLVSEGTLLGAYIEGRVAAVHKVGTCSSGGTRMCFLNRVRFLEPPRSFRLVLRGTRD